MKTNQSGFTLVEMAIVLVIVGFLLGGGLTVLSTQQEQRRIDETVTLLNEARDALTGFALTHSAIDARPYLPCPDKTGAAGVGTPNDGQEDRIPATGSCVVQEGNLPWVDLGIGIDDRWANRIRYQVTAAFSNNITGMQLSSTGNITILDAVGGNAVANNAPAVLLSHGKNGSGAFNASGTANPLPTGADELENTNANQTFVTHPFIGPGGTGGEFDDLVIWLSPNILFNRMVTGGMLP